MNELRKDRRAPASLKVKYKSATVDEFVEQFGADVSRGGIFIKTKKPLDTGALLKFEFQLQGGVAIIGGVGRVAWRRTEDKARPDLPAGMGIKFIKLDEQSRGVVERIESRHGIGSRFDQTENAELAAPLSSMPPAPTADLPAAPPPVRFTTAPPSSAAVTHDQPTFRPPPPAVSSFPPALGDGWPPNGKPSSGPAPKGALGAFPSTPARKPGRSLRSPARDTSEFLASAFSVGGAGAEVRSQARVQVERARRDPQSVDLANELFGDLSEPTQHTALPAAAAVDGPGLQDMGERLDSKPATALERSLSDRIPSLDDLVNEPTSAGIPPKSHRPIPLAPPLSAAGASMPPRRSVPANDAKPLSLALSAPPAAGAGALRANANPPSSSVMKLVLGGLALLAVAAAAFVFVRNSQTNHAVVSTPLPSPPSAAEPSAPATPEPVAAQSPSAAAVTLQVRISSEPRTAELSVDDKVIGTTPAQVPMVAGTPVTLTLRSSGYATKVEQVTPKVGDSALTFALTPLQYSLVIDSTPAGAIVRVNDAKIEAPKPLSLGHIEGMVTASIEKEGFARMSRVVQLDEFHEHEGAMEAQVSVSLSPLPAAAVARRRPAFVRDAPPVPSAEPPAPSAPPPVMQIKPEGSAAEAALPSPPPAAATPAAPAAPVAVPEPPPAPTPSDPPAPAAE
jgi:uncharacterized protein (TIGR02266 family)